MPEDYIDHLPAHHVLPSDPVLRVKALETILVRKGLVDPKAVDAIIDTYESKIGPMNGAQVVAKAWSDPVFLDKLLQDATTTVAELGFYGRQGEHIIALQNTEKVHNLVVCTLCSCYPWPLLGIPPAWYKSDAYRARAVREPRQVLAEFGVKLSPDQEVRVWDSTSEIRYLVVPIRTAFTAGWPQDKLTELVSRDSMIGTAVLEVTT